MLLDDLTLLLGSNNAGKTSFLYALFAAIGVGQRVIHPEDIFIRTGDRSAPKERAVLIDILIRPVGSEGQVLDTFPAGSPWLELWGNGISQDGDENDFVGLRTSYRWNPLRADYVLERKFLRDWVEDSSDLENAKLLDGVPNVQVAQIDPLGLYLLDAQRDITLDLRARGSFWNKMVEDHGLNDEQIQSIEDELTEINSRIVESSPVFNHIQEHLKGFHKTLSCDEDGVSIAPLTRQMRDLARGMDVTLATSGAPPFSIAQQGMGTRSLGTFFTFWAFTTWRQQQAQTEALHPFMGMEEPECHLHPQAQRALIRQIRALPAQRIVTTHSPHVVALCDISSFRHFSKRGEETVVNSVTPSAGLSPEDLRKIDRQVLNTRGEILFARGLILFEGETEEQALPDFAEKHWGQHPHELELSFVGVGGFGGYLPFLRMAQTFEIPWFIFSDGEAEAVAAIDSALRAIGQPASAGNSRVVVIPGGQNFEEYIVSTADVQPLVDEVVRWKAVSPQHAEALKTKWENRSEQEKRAEMLKQMLAAKTQFGSRLGKVLPVPEVLSELFDEIMTDLSGGDGAGAL